MVTYPDQGQRHSLVAGCERCPALAESRECISWGNGPLEASVLVVGEAPGAGNPDADRWQGGNWTGMAYTSRHSGRRIRELLATAGYGHDECYYTNAVKCFPADGEGSNREPTAEERENCRPYLREEIETVAPAVVIPTGKHATKSVLALDGTALDGFLETVLEPIPVPELGTTVLPLVHPSYQEIWVARLGYTEQSYRETLARELDRLVVDSE